MSWEIVSTLASAVAASCAAIAAFLSYKHLRASKEIIQVQIFENVFREIREQERQFYGLLPKTPEDKGLRDRLFFNTIEYLAFLLNKRILRRADFRDYYRDAFLYWWEMFEKEVPKEDRDRPENYQEFKKLIGDLRKANQ